jgi:hypothetical protein
MISDEGIKIEYKIIYVYMINNKINIWLIMIYLILNWLIMI